MTMNNETTLSPEEICKDDYIFKVPANVTWPEVKPCLKCGAEGTTIYTPKDDTFYVHCKERCQEEQYKDQLGYPVKTLEDWQRRFDIVT